MQRIRAVFWKEVLHIIRDPRTLALIILMPAMQLILYGFAINTDVKHIKTALYNEDQSPLSRRLVESLVQSAYFDVTVKVSSDEELAHAIDSGDVKVGLHIPTDFAKKVLSGRPTPLQMLIDGTDSNPANTALNTGQAVIAAFVQKEGLVPFTVSPIEFRPRLWYNPDLKSVYFMVPGLVGLLIQMLIPMITATAIVREKERGNLEQLLVTPIKRYELMVGKIIPYLMIGLIIAVMILGTAHVLFDVPIRGNPITLLVTTFLFLTVCLGIGLFASTVASNQQQAAQMVMFLMPPSILLAGFIFPREGMPRPIYYMGYAIRGIVLKGLGFRDLWQQILPLLAMAVSIVTLSVLKFRKRLD
jgi:ABC-2 type transport system permease protein